MLSREIKFQLIDPITNIVHWYERLEVEVGKRRNRWINESKDSYWNWVYSREYIRRQYTWLKDKNWVEVYEFDIIQRENWLLDMVEYWNNWFYLNDIFKTRFEWDEVEVIWNIYQNPELLNQ